MVENAVDGGVVERCELEEEVGLRGAKQWCLFYGEVEPGGETGWEPIRARAGCVEGQCDAVGSSPLRTMRGSPYLLVDVSATANSPPKGEGGIGVAIGLRRLARFSSDGKPVYEQSTEERMLTGREARESVVPLLLSTAKEKEAFGVHEVLLRIGARSLAGRPAAAFGKISVTSDVPIADVLLDGGAVGRITDGRPFVLENVLVGERDLRLRDLSGREARKVVKVTKDRTVGVQLGLLPAPRPPTSDGLLPLGKNPQGREEYAREKDGAVVVRIPAGAFRMGSPEGEGEPPEHPQHEVHVAEFLMDKTEVTWRQYLQFAQATGAPLPPEPLWGRRNDYPATSVTWDQAKAFCEWVGGRLPTEAEWEKAARGTDGRRYPWGDDWDENRCNTIDGGPHRPDRVGAYPDCVSPYGVLDMAGSVWEWCADWFDEKYYESSPATDPKGPPEGRARVARGGSWLNPFTWVRTAFRYSTDPTWPDTLHGFRCVQIPPG